MAPQLVETFPQDKEYLHNYCSTAIYILTLLLDGYKFSEHTWSSIHFRQQVRTPRALPPTHVQEQHPRSPLHQKCVLIAGLLPSDPSPVTPAQLHSSFPALNV